MDNTTKKMIDDLEIGKMIDLKLGLSTRQIERIEDKKYIINDFIDGWEQAEVDKETILKLIDGEISLLDLDWY